MQILRVQDLCKSYNIGDNVVKALNGVSFSVEEGEFVAIIGPSGSGKSTLLHLLGGVDIPTSGKVYVDDEDIYSLSKRQLAIFRRRQVGLIYQFYNLIPTLNVVENITLPLSLDRKTVDKSYLKELLEILQLKNRRKHLPQELSGGQQQRVAIGRALITNPSLVLADEATGNLDKKNSNEIISLLRYLNEAYGQTLIMVTHDESIAYQANRIITMEDGQILRDEVIR